MIRMGPWIVDRVAPVGTEVRLVCLRVGAMRTFGDDVEAPCSRCRAMCFHRPHAPAEAVIICVQCAAPDLLRGPPVAVTPETLAELRSLRRRH